MEKVIVWNPKCVPSHIETFSPSWKKPREFMQSIAPMIDYQNMRVVISDSVGKELLKVHSKEYVKGVLSGAKPNGFGTRDTEAAESCLYTSGAMLKGVELATSGISSCVPVSGFHHAGYDYGGGFCTFNGLALAAVKAEELGMQAGILDLDMHYGDGTVDIFSFIAKEYPHYTYGGTTFAEKGKGKLFLGKLPSILERVFGKCDVLLYQAGADPHVNDPLGGCLTTGELRKRDQIVFEFCASRGMPVVWDLAGGYQNPLSKVLEVHTNTFNEWVKAG